MTQDQPRRDVAYTNVTADDWVTADQPRPFDPGPPGTEWCAPCGAFRPPMHAPDHDARALMDLVDQRAADDVETGADGGEL